MPSDRPNMIWGPVAEALAQGFSRATKAQSLAASAPRSWVDGELSITIDEVSAANGVLRVRASALRNGVPVQVNNPLYFANPPILAPTGNTVMVNGKPEREFKENLPQVFKQIVADTVRLF